MFCGVMWQKGRSISVQIISWRYECYNKNRIHSLIWKYFFINQQIRRELLFITKSCKLINHQWFIANFNLKKFTEYSKIQKGSSSTSLFSIGTRTLYEILPYRCFISVISYLIKDLWKQKLMTGYPRVYFKFTFRVLRFFYIVASEEVFIYSGSE